MRHTKKAYGLLLASCLLSASLLLASCEGRDTPDTTDTGDTTEESVADTTPESKTDYTVTVLYHDGTPATDIIVKVQKAGEDVAFKLIGADGSASFSLETGDYTVLLESPSGVAFHYDTTTAVLSEAAPELTVSIYTAVSATQSISAPSLNSSEYIRFDAALVGEGKTHIDFNTGDHTYVVFTPTRDGVYEITYESDYAVELIYRGAPINVFDMPLLDTVDGVVSLTVRASSLGETVENTAQYVFSFDPVDGAGSGCVVSITRVSDVPRSPVDEPWTVLTAPEGALTPYVGVYGDTMVDVDVTDPDLAVVLNESDGYYHLGTADGPVVFLRLSTAGPYLDDFNTICEATRICAYIYNEDGTFNRKESYNELIAEYLTIANEDGVVPLNEQLAYMVQSAGNYMGWWNFADDRDIFGDKIVPVDTAWLFACVYYQ